ncbi:MAG: putative glycosyltransferase [Bryobacterales bacterium]|nr:putative glycosyltransferase [Bryobacterales bacterium]
MPDLSFVLVNWNCMAFTMQCLAAIQETVAGLEYEVIVVDNASGDAPCQDLANRFPSVKLILSSENLGFGGANNLAARAAAGRVLFFLNPDTILLRDAARRACDLLESRPDAGIVGCRFLNPDGSLQLSSVQAFPSVTNQLLANRRLQQWWPSAQGKSALYTHEPVSEVDVVSGAGLLMLKTVFDRIGGFSKEYFMYAEEVDLCYGVHRAGLRVLHCRRAEIIHFGGQSTKQCEAGYVDLAMRESVHHFLWCTQGARSAAFYRAALLLGAAVRLSALSISLPFVKAGRRELALLVMRKWCRIASWALAPRDAKAGFLRPKVSQASSL